MVVCELLPKGPYAGKYYLQLMWAGIAVCGLVANNVGPVAINVGPWHRIVAVNVVPQRGLFAGLWIYDCGPLHLARSTLHLCQIAAELERKGVSLQVLDQNIDTGDATGRLLFNMLGTIGQFETEIRAERQMDGIKKARERGVRFGRSKSLTEKQTAELREKRKEGTLIKTLMKEYGLSKASVYRYLGEAEIALSAAARD